MQAKTGDNVIVDTKDKEVKGILMPVPESEGEVVILKLESGYNIGIDKKDVKEIKLVKSYSEKKQKTAEIKQNKSFQLFQYCILAGQLLQKLIIKQAA